MSSYLDKTGLTYLWGKLKTKLDAKQDALTFDSTPTQNSTNPVTSGGIYNVIGDIETILEELL